jgi:hypothetical protein
MTTLGSTSPRMYRLSIDTLIDSISSDDNLYKNEIKKRNIDGVNWTNFLNKARRTLIKQPETFLSPSTELIELRNIIQTLTKDITDESHILRIRRRSSYDSSVNRLFEMILNKAELELKHIISANKALSSSLYLCQPIEWYPLARMMKRKIIYHGGPTNSGKVRITIITSYIC